MNPILKHLEIKRQITSDLVFYANVIETEGLNDEMQKRRNDRQENNRKHAADLKANYYRLPYLYRRYLKRVSEDPVAASDMLIGLSNSNKVVLGENYIPNLMKHLRIPDSIDV